MTFCDGEQIGTSSQKPNTAGRLASDGKLTEAKI